MEPSKKYGAHDEVVNTGPMGDTSHIVPVNDIVAHCVEGVRCICCPTLLVPGLYGDGVVVTHIALDGRSPIITIES
jgi:hypothetical protein